MNEPKPLLREGASDFERQLLSAVMRERPSPQMHSRMRRALGLTGPLAWASSVKAMLVSLAGKGAVGAAVVGLVAAGAIGVASTRADGSAEPIAPVASAPIASAPIAASPAPSVVPAPAASRSEEERAPPAANPPPSGELREEIQLLDQARAALQSGSGAAALEHLDRYRERFPAGVLRREAALLRQRASMSSSARTSRPGRTR